MSGFEVNVDEMRASAGLVRSIGDDLAGPVDTAVKGASSAAGLLAGWSLAGGLEQLASGWGGPLAALRQRLADTGANLEATAQNHQWNDQSIADTWKAQGVR
ncbi:hypothetical protein [Kitasatospora indigofera]|uniref:hypothetical protein n=1 Tax=Kitasatospora indigofera TaxID=67307 RepID=UPI0036BF718B